jgi:hypothetical protein
MRLDNLFFEAALLGLIIGWLRGGTLKKLGQVNLSAWPLALLGLAVQASILVDFHFGWHYLAALGPGLHILSFLPLLFFLYENLNKRGMMLLGTGISLNLVVITFNGGRMPVRIDSIPETAQQVLLSGTASPLHSAMTGETLLPFLGDILGIPFFWNQSLSVGDMLMSAGIFLVVQNFIKPKKTSKSAG